MTPTFSPPLPTRALIQNEKKRGEVEKTIFIIETKGNDKELGDEKWGTKVDKTLLGRSRGKGRRGRPGQYRLLLHLLLENLILLLLHLCRRPPLPRLRGRFFLQFPRIQR